MTCGESATCGGALALISMQAVDTPARLFSPPIAGSVFLLHARPAALDQNEQHNEKQNSGNDTNERHIIHCIASLLLVSEIRFERLLDHNDCRTKNDDK